MNNPKRIEALLTGLFTSIIIIACSIVENPKLNEDYQPRQAGTEESNVEVVLFTLEGCRHCKVFKPKWERICDKYKNVPGVTTEQHNVLQDSNHDKFLRPFEEKYNCDIRVFPFLIITKNGKRVSNPDFKFESTIKWKDVCKEIDRVKNDDSE